MLLVIALPQPPPTLCFCISLQMSYEMRIYWWSETHWTLLLWNMWLWASHNLFAPRWWWHLSWVQRFIRRPQMTSPKLGNLFLWELLLSVRNTAPFYMILRHQSKHYWTKLSYQVRICQEFSFPLPGMWGNTSWCVCVCVAGGWGVV